tara:strand:+ start:258 stop:482 length:225 start_codon:yes stop_codon:yes gene_type:complete
MKKTYSRLCQLHADILNLLNKRNWRSPRNFKGINHYYKIENSRYEMVICEYTGDKSKDYRFEADAELITRELIK